MKLLVITQTVDTDDPVLGFFHHWLEVFASRFDSIEVICLNEGRHALPGNVRVHTLGKKHSLTSAPYLLNDMIYHIIQKITYSVRFYRTLWRLRGRYDAIFVHMNPEYILLAGAFWLLGGKKIGLWYNHDTGSLPLRLASPFVWKHFHTSPYAYPARYPHAVRMPAGIDTSIFRSTGAARTPRSVYFQGRVAPAKRVHILLAALQTLHARSARATATIVGPIDHTYGVRLHREFDDLLDGDGVLMLGPKRNEETPALYASHAVAVNLTADGNFDKSVLEALASETPVIVSSRAFSGLVKDAWTVPHENASALADTLEAFFTLSDAERRRLGAEGRATVVAEHSLDALANALAKHYAI